MKIITNSYTDFIDELKADYDDDKIREHIIRTCKIRYEQRSDWRYELYFAYRRNVDPQDANSDEIIELRIQMGIAIFHNHTDSEKIKSAIDEKSKQIQMELSTIPNLKLRLGCFYDNNQKIISKN